MTLMLSQEGWIASRVNEELSAAIEWAGQAIALNDGASPYQKVQQTPEYAVSYEYDGVQKKWVKVRVQFAQDHGESVQMISYTHGNHLRLRDSETIINASILRDASATYKKETGRLKIPDKSLIYLQDFEIVAWMKIERPTYELRIKRFVSMSKVPQELDVVSQRIEDYEFMQEIHNLLAKYFHIKPPAQKRPSAVRSSSGEEEADLEGEEKLQSVFSPPTPVYAPTTPPVHRTDSLNSPSLSAELVTKTYSRNIPISPKPGKMARAYTGAEDDSFRENPIGNDEIIQRTIEREPSKISLNDWTNMPRLKRSITRVPEQQVRLLQTLEVWLPPQPGRQFPTPSLPLSVLKDLEDTRLRKAEEIAKQGAIQSPVIQYPTLPPQAKPEKSLFVSEDTDSEADLGTREEDIESDDELLPGTWDSSPYIGRTRDALPKDSSPGIPRHNSPLQLHVAATASRSPSQPKPELELEMDPPLEAEIESDLEPKPEVQPTPEIEPQLEPDLNPSLEQGVGPYSESMMDVQASVEDSEPSTRSLITDISSAIPTTNPGVEELPASDSTIIHVKKKSRRSILPWEQREKAEREKAEQAESSNAKMQTNGSPQQGRRIMSVAAFAEDAANALSVTRIKTPRRTIGPILKELTSEYVRSSTPTSTPPSFQERISLNLKKPRSSLNSSVQAHNTDPVPTSSVEMPSEIPQHLPKASPMIPKAKSGGAIHVPETPRVMHDELSQDMDESSELPPSPPRTQPMKETALVPSTHPIVSNSRSSPDSNNSRHSHLGSPSGKKRKEIPADVEMPHKRAKVAMRYNMTQDTPVRNDPRVEAANLRNSFIQKASRQPLTSPTAGTQQTIQTPVVSEQQRGTINSSTPGPSFSHQSSFRRGTPMSTPQRVIMPPPSQAASRRTSFEMLPPFTLNDVFEEFVDRYKYPGSKEQLLNVCKRLADAKSNWFEFLFDDVIMRQATEYPEYVSRCVALDEDNLKFPEWAKKEIRGQKYGEGIMSIEKLEIIMDHCRAQSLFKYENQLI